MAGQLRIGVDIGGTFTDAIAVTPAGIRVSKVASNTARPSAAVLEAISALALDTAPARFLHGTTIVTNMLLERKGARTGFITSQGMRDILHIGRHERPLNYAVRQEIPQQHHPPVPRKWRYSVPERVGADGAVVVSLDEEAVRRAARILASEGVEAIAIGFLHAYRYPAHEKRALELVAEEAPLAFLCTSGEVSPRFREYERFLTTAWNARVAPAATRYLSDLARDIDALWKGVKLTLMTSNGGLEEISMDSAGAPAGGVRRTPIRLALSGPAAAGNAVVKVAKELGLQHCVGLDVGGTSSDIVVVRDGRLHEAPWEERRVGGYPLQIPMLDLHSIGAGGGSLVSQDAFGTLHVGPQSAGALPGPACYDRGGDRPTVTDAAVVVGRLPKQVKLGGTLPIRADLAWKAFREQFPGTDEAQQIEAALNVLTLAEANIAFAVRERTVARGLDPGELALVVAGGAGPLLACGVADALELGEVVIPPYPGLLAAWGLLVAPDRRESVVTVLRLLRDLSAAEAADLVDQARRGLEASVPSGAEMVYTASLRYLGQGFEVEVPAELPVKLTTLARTFHEAHQREYGFSLADSPVEWIELRVAWEKPAEPWAFPELEGLVEPAAHVPLWEREAPSSVDHRGTPVRRQAALIERRSLREGDRVAGPAVILEQDATTYIPIGWMGRMASGDYLRLRSHDR